MIYASDFAGKRKDKKYCNFLKVTIQRILLLTNVFRRSMNFLKIVSPMATKLLNAGNN